MAAGYGFGGEGDWKTSALVRAMKVMAEGLEGGTSFMEDYTYHLAPGGHKVLGAHMLEICPTIAANKPRVEIHPLGIGGKADPVRLVFDTPAGAAINASMVDVGNRFRLIVNEVAAVAADEPLPHLPVARAVWEPKPDFKTACAGVDLGGRRASHRVFPRDWQRRNGRFRRNRGHRVSVHRRWHHDSRFEAGVAHERGLLRARAGFWFGLDQHKIWFYVAFYCILSQEVR